MRLFASRFLVPQERADACSGHGRACGATESAPSSTPCPSLSRGRSDKLPSGAQLSSLSFLVGTLWASMGSFKVEQMMFLKLNQGCLPEVQKYNTVIAVSVAQQARHNQYLQDVQSAQEAAAGETVDVEI